MNDANLTDLKMTVQRLDQNQEYVTRALEQMSNSLKELVTLQKDHDVLRAEIYASKEATANRVNKIESSHTWMVRLVGAAIVLQALAQLWK